ncbi:MAG: leucine-rich repeat protein [Ruminococcus flavefaciens]|nr:leucine-rich repeat protein [Ruminococcus flavefaciens]
MIELTHTYIKMGINVDLIQDVTIETYKNLAEDTLIYIMAHGSETPYITTTEQISVAKDKIYKKEIKSKDVAIISCKDGNKYYWIKPSFFKNVYKNNKLNNPIVLMSCCCGFGRNGIANFEFADSLAEAGANTSIGFCNSVHELYSDTFYSTILYELSKGKTIGEAFRYSQDTVGRNENAFMNTYSNSKSLENAYPIISSENENKKLFNNSISEVGYYSATIKDKYSDNPISDIGIIIYDKQHNDRKQIGSIYCYKSDVKGTFTAELPAGEYVCYLTHPDYKTETFNTTIENGDMISLLEPIYMTRKTGTLDGMVIINEDNSFIPIPDVKVEAISSESDNNEPVATATTDKNGNFKITLPYGRYTLNLTHDDYESYSMSVEVKDEYKTMPDTIMLTPKGKDTRPVTDSGTCGENVNWTLYDDGELVISGEGEMEDYKYHSAPWYYKYKKITKITINNGVTNIGSYAFYDCDSLTSITIPNSVTSIGSSAFRNCGSLTSVTIPDNITRINPSTFSNCNSLISITIPNRVTWISEGAFYNCDNLTSVTIGNSVTYIWDSAFSDCDSLTSVTIGNSVTIIDKYAFYNCDSLTNITIPDSVKSIGELAFAGCDSLTSIIIPDSVTSISYGAFGDCDSLERVSLNPNNEFYTYSDGVLYNKNKTELIQYLAGKKETSYKIPDSVTTIGSYAFYSCDNLTSIIIHDSVTSIYYSAFRNCDNLTSVIIGNSVTSIGGCAFENCVNLASITIPDSVTDIGFYAFSNCDSLTSITIPDSVTDIGFYVFSKCDNLASVIIGNSVTRIDEYAFQDCYNLTSVTIGNNVKSIGTLSFDNCRSLTNITIPDSVTSIGDSAFNNCDSLTNITIPDSVSYMGKKVFCACDNLTSVTIGNSVTTIDHAVFYGCYNLTSVTIGNSVTSIDDSAFYNCGSLKSVTIPDSVTSIGSSAFYNCRSLASVTIGNSVTSIGNSVFYNCDSLTSVTIPNSVTSIGNDAFYNCDSLTSITINNSSCTIYDSEYTISTTATIYGYTNSTAQAYAEKYNRPFVALDA